MENLRADYVRTATAKGLRRGRVVGVHALRNSLIPVITYLGVDLGALMGGAIITETVFNLPGIGRAVFDAVGRQEGTVVVGIVTFLVLIYMVSNLFVDVMYAVLDPGFAMTDDRAGTTSGRKRPRRLLRQHWPVRC